MLVKTDNGMNRLGDIVVSKPVGEHSGAVQYDHGKAKAGKFERTGAHTTASSASQCRAGSGSKASQVT